MRASLLLGLVGVTIGCGGFHQVASDDLAIPPADAGTDGPTTNGLTDAGVLLDGSHGDLASRIAQAPPDSPCAQRDYWTTVGRQTCQDRRVFAVESAILDPATVSLAISQSGHVGIVYRSMEDPDETDLHVAHFDRSQVVSNMPLQPTISTHPSSTIGERVGVASAIAGGQNDQLHVAYLIDAEWAKGLYYQTLATGGFDSATGELVEDNLSASGEVSIGVAPSGNVFVTNFNPVVGEIHSHERMGGTWAPQQIVASSLDATYGTGKMAMTMDPNLPRVAYYEHTTLPLSKPVFDEFDGTNWSMPQTVDNFSLGGTTQCGMSPGLAIFGTWKYVSYLVSVSDSAAQIEVGSWQDDLDVPSHSIVVDSIAYNKAQPLTRTSLAVDSFGLLHLMAFVQNDLGGGTVEYHRQTVIQGTTAWIADIVDDLTDTNDPSDPNYALVSIAVDENDRPHLAYYNSGTGTINYATRFDR